jgi:hypothetical protein
MRYDYCMRFRLWPKNVEAGTPDQPERFNTVAQKPDGTLASPDITLTLA